MQILIVKTSSMGDLIHTLPAISDIRRKYPKAQIDWLVEEAFQEIPAWHPAIRRVITVSLRNSWWHQLQKLPLVPGWLRRQRRTRYDVIIDAQGLIKSALLAKCMNSRHIVGFDKYSIKESLASTWYDRAYAVDKNQHAIARVRQLCAQALNYQLPEQLEYNISHNFATHTNWAGHAAPAGHGSPYVIFLHGTTWETKHWPEEYWQKLIYIAEQHDLQVKMTWAGAEQQARVQRLTANAPNAQMLPHLSLSEAGQVLNYAQGVISVDTGFGHLATALNIPTVSVFGPTNPHKSGTLGAKQLSLASKYHCAPCMRKKCKFSEQPFPPCFKELTPERVWDELINIWRSTQ